MRAHVINVLKKVPFLVEARKTLRRRKKRRQAERDRKRKEALLAKHGVVSVGDLFGELRRAGLPDGATLLVHSSFQGLATFGGEPEDALEMLRALVGPSGTLLMPAFSTNTWQVPARRFHPPREPTYAGIINEIFRLAPGSLRSLHPRHSITGCGPAAAEILEGHERCKYAEGRDSPMDKMRLRDDAYMLWLGVVPLDAMTFIHWIESFEPEAFPDEAFEPTPVDCEMVMPDGSVKAIQDWLPRQTMKGNMKTLGRRLYGKAVQSWTYKGIPLGLCRAKDLAEALVALRDEGVKIYTF